MLDDLYENIGGKIKNLAKWTFIIETIGAVVTAMVLLADEFVLVGLLTLFCGPIVAWISSWILYAFGEIVEKLSDTNKIAKKIENNTRNFNIKHQEKLEIKESDPTTKIHQEQSITNQETTKPTVYDLPIYSPNGFKPCEKETHKNYKDLVGNNIGVKTKDGHWEIDSVLNEKVFVCNHCHGIVAFETEFNNK